MGEQTDTISGHAVIRAVHDLHERAAQWPTLEEVATYLQTTDAAAEQALLELRGERLFKDRQRQGRRIWAPWGEAV